MAPLDPVAPVVLADLMLAGALDGRAHIVAMQRNGDRCAVTLEIGGEAVAGFEVPAEVGEAAAVRLAVAARIHWHSDEGAVARVAVRAGARTGVVVLSIGPAREGGRVEIQRLGCSGERAISLKRCPVCDAFQPPQRRVCDADGAPLIDVADDPRSGGTIGAYRIDEQLGAGQMGAVFAARHAIIGRPAAIKVLHRSLAHDPAIARRFLREARAASRLRHPNVVEVTDFGLLPDGRPFLVMERLRGELLDALLGRSGALLPRPALLIARELAAALDAAHGAGVVHNDLKPGNVMLLEGSTLEAPRLALMDFGAASFLLDGATDADGVIIGTPHYMAPERASGERSDARADLYALGVVLYEMLSGKVPHDSDSVCVVLFAQVHRTPPPLKSPHGALPQEVTRLVFRALAKYPEARHQSARELIADLDAALAALGRPRWHKLLLGH